MRTKSWQLKCGGISESKSGIARLALLQVAGSCMASDARPHLKERSLYSSVLESGRVHSLSRSAAAGAVTYFQTASAVAFNCRRSVISRFI